jgi:hypothetical protein
MLTSAQISVQQHFNDLKVKPEFLNDFFVKNERGSCKTCYKVEEIRRSLQSNSSTSEKVVDDCDDDCKRGD